MTEPTKKTEIEKAVRDARIILAEIGVFIDGGVHSARSFARLTNQLGLLAALARGLPEDTG